MCSAVGAATTAAPVNRAGMQPKPPTLLLFDAQGNASKDRLPQP